MAATIEPPSCTLSDEQIRLAKQSHRSLREKRDGKKCRTPLCPTDAIPGSEAKICVLEERRARREALHHPADFCFRLEVVLW